MLAMTMLPRLGLTILCAITVSGVLPAQTQSSGPVVIDTFTNLRTNDTSGSSNQLWWAGGQHSDQTCDTMGSFSGGKMVIAAPKNGTCTGQMVDGMNGPGMANVTFFPRNDSGNPSATPCTQASGCEYVNGYTQVIPPGTDWTKLNRLYFTITADTTNATLSRNYGNGLQFGYYIKSLNNNVSQNQGHHYYGNMDTGIYAGQPLYFVLNRKVQHSNTAANGYDLYPEDPEYNACCGGDNAGYAPVHMWQGETYFYLAAGVNLAGWVGNFTFTPMTLGAESYQEPDDFVSNITGTYVGSGQESGFGQTYEVTWQDNRLIPGATNYHVYYNSTCSMHVCGLNNANTVSGGAVRGQNQGSTDASPYGTTYWNSPVMGAVTNLWVAIRPDMNIWTVKQQGAGVNIQVQTRSPYDRHWLQTGDQVSIANLCPAANGTRTVTVIDNYTVDLGVQGSCSYAGYTSSSSGTMTATSNTQNFSEILIGPGTGGGGGGGSFSPCDLNQDGVTNSADFALSQSQALGQSACTGDLNGDGLCTVVDVQRVANAANGGACKVGP